MNTQLKSDQQEYEDSNRVLLAESQLYENRIRASNQQVPPRPAACTSQDLIAANSALRSHVEQLKTLAGATSSPATQKPAVSAKTLTEKVLAAQGVKTLSELTTLNDPLD